MAITMHTAFPRVAESLCRENGGFPSIVMMNSALSDQRLFG